VIEGLQNARWLLDRVELSEPELARVYRIHADFWVPALMSPRVPVETKREIFRHVRAIDPHPSRRILRPALDTLRHTLSRRWRSLHGRASAAGGRERAKRSA
jgi:hypothetical protein